MTQPHEDYHKWRWRGLSLWIILFTAAAIWLAHDLRGLIQSDRDRVHDIQLSRVYSCEKTYRSFPEMFRPFFPSDQTKWSPQVRRNWSKLQHRATELAAKCDTQVKPKGG